MKISIVYHSESGNTKKIAEIIKETVESINGIEAKAINIVNLDNRFIDDSQDVKLGSPT